jgi:DNA repair protein RecO (recombination protein O)
MFIQTPAIVLKSFPYSDTSIIARCFTLEKGKISFIIKGARSKKSGKENRGIFNWFQNVVLLKPGQKYLRI